MGMDGIGWVMTSSPTSSTTDCPSASNASTLAPRHLHCISPAYTGSRSQEPTNPVQRSVPPLNEPSSKSDPTLSYTHSNPSGESGEPVDPRLLILEVSKSRPGSTPAFMHAYMNGAAVPKYVTPASSANLQSAFMSGYDGSPSYSTAVAPCSKPPIRKFHIIQPVVVNQKKRSPCPISMCRESTFRCSSRMPPCPWTIGFGRPVVPDE